MDGLNLFYGLVYLLSEILIKKINEKGKFWIPKGDQIYFNC